MRITMVDAMSVDGRIAAGDVGSAQTWISTEDDMRFRALRRSYDTVIMGRKTYDAVQPSPNVNRLKVVLTRRPADYAAQTHPGTLEFTDEAAPVLIESLRTRGRQNVLIYGGGEINRLFLEHGLVDDLFLTVEPVLLGQGARLVSGGDALGTGLILQSVEQLNDRGTLLLHYVVEGSKD